MVPKAWNKNGECVIWVVSDLLLWVLDKVFGVLLASFPLGGSALNEMNKMNVGSQGLDNKNGEYVIWVVSY